MCLSFLLLIVLVCYDMIPSVSNVPYLSMITSFYLKNINSNCIMCAKLKHNSKLINFFRVLFVLEDVYFFLVFRSASCSLFKRYVILDHNLILSLSYVTYLINMPPFAPKKIKSKCIIYYD